MSAIRLFVLTLLAMLAFAGNSLLCRAALSQTNIDAASFTSIRMFAGAVTLWMVVMLFRAGGQTRVGQGNWPSALALFVYAAGFSFAYVSLPTATGALLLFGSVQATMIGVGLWRGERFGGVQWSGLLLALGGVIGLLLPGITAPPPVGAALMIAAGMAWGVYSLRGRGAGDATLVTAGNFWRAAVIAALLSAVLLSRASVDVAGAVYAIASGAITSGIGYAIWYAALPSLKATTAATVQLSVPAIAALGGVMLLGEAMTLRLWLASVAILGGIALVVLTKSATKS
jgi:drug/metabolite transporter (DMT)-like permease